MSKKDTSYKKCHAACSGFVRAVKGFVAGALIAGSVSHDDKLDEYNSSRTRLDEETTYITNAEDDSLLDKINPFKRESPCKPEVVIQHTLQGTVQKKVVHTDCPDKFTEKV
ncbi:MAG: hypothetical protein AAF988_02195 [Pseudomonadota bacterium]